jgi:hypothetical protein
VRTSRVNQCQVQAFYKTQPVVGNNARRSVCVGRGPVKKAAPRGDVLVQKQNAAESDDELLSNYAS